MRFVFRVLLIVTILCPAGAARAAAPPHDCQVCHRHVCCCPEMCAHNPAAVTSKVCSTHNSCTLSDEEGSSALKFEHELPSSQDPRLLSFQLPSLDVNEQTHFYRFGINSPPFPASDIHTPPPRRNA